MNATTKISGTFGVHPDGCDPYAVVIRDGKWRGMWAASDHDTMVAARDPRAEYQIGGKEVDADTARAVLAILSEDGDTLDPEQHVVTAME